MSHFMFPRTGMTMDREIMNSVVLDNDILDTNDLLSNSTSSSSNASTVDSSDSSTILAPRQPRVVVSEEPRCWICFGDNSDSQGKWVKPCKCTLEVHQSCLLDWIAENQKASPTKKVRCPQCALPYYLAQNDNLTLALLTVVDSLARTTAPYITVLGLGCSLLITCTTYGAFSVIALLGPRDGERLIGNPNYWTYKTWIGLPLIPVLLVSTKTRWGDAILPVAAVTLLRATGHTPHQIRFSWPMSPAFTIGIMPWVRLFYKNAYRLAQRYITRNLSLQQQQQKDPIVLSNTRRNNRSNTTESSNNNNNSSSSSSNISERERSLEFDMINGRDTGSVGVSLISALLWPAISSGMGG
ncbi:hypothetical protein BD770DRAFT_329092 [Pilaira anomala]|nr:hypothetical protein BD770DRAFT_329092 [Pilaira anomala]